MRLPNIVQPNLLFLSLGLIRPWQQTRILVVQLEEKRYSFGIGFCRGRLETCPYVGGINGLIQRLMRFSQVRRHGNGIIEVGE